MCIRHVQTCSLVFEVFKVSVVFEVRNTWMAHDTDDKRVGGPSPAGAWLDASDLDSRRVLRCWIRVDHDLGRSRISHVNICTI